jgi:iron complex transport system ATP-binding protein
MYEARDIHVRLGDRAILAGVDLAIAPGAITVVVGPNGAGKSTLLRAIAGERKPTAGRITIDGRDIATMGAAALAARRAVLAQSTTMAFPFAVADVVAIGAPPRLRRVEVDGHVARAAAAVDLGQALERPITQLSGGEQQRAHMARVLVQLWAQRGTAPGYLLLDEPTAHLDPAHQRQLAHLARAHARAGGGVLAILHDLNLAAALADTLVVLADGRVIASGPPGEVLTAEVLRATYGIDFRILGGDNGRFIAPDLSEGA